MRKDRGPSVRGPSQCYRIQWLKNSSCQESPVRLNQYDSPKSGDKAVRTTILFPPQKNLGAFLLTKKVAPYSTFHEISSLLNHVVRATKAGVKPFTTQDLRRTYASGMLDMGADVFAVQMLLGHAKDATTQRYDYRDEKAKRKAAELFHLPYVAFEPQLGESK